MLCFTNVFFVCVLFSKRFEICQIYSVCSTYHISMKFYIIKSEEIVKRNMLETCKEQFYIKTKKLVLANLVDITVAM